MDLSIDKFGQGEASIIARNGPTKSLGKHEFYEPSLHCTLKSSFNHTEQWNSKIKYLCVFHFKFVSLFYFNSSNSVLLCLNIYPGKYGQYPSWKI